jgi:NADH:ubiquinone oxidoreductase subunit F (NADH-binding)
MAFQPGTYRLLAGPAASAGAEPLRAHETRLGTWRASRISGWDLIAELEQSGLLGRGGAGFPVGRKWRSVAVRADGRAVVLVNGAEGEPRSHKDRVLMAHRPHLILDGAMLAAEAIGADEVIVYVGEEHGPAKAALRDAIAERAAGAEPPIRVLEAPISYVAGEASAAVSYVNRGLALPTSPPRPSERGVDGRPTLVQNVESLAYAALIARYGADWYREPGLVMTRGTALVTVGSLTDRPRIREIELGTTVGELAASAGLTADAVGAALVGGYFGTWTSAEEAWGLRLDPETMKATGRTFGCGMVSLLPSDTCGVVATADVIGFLARSSAGQCGPCKFGLAAIAATAQDLAACRAGMAELEELESLLGLVEGRGACHHPDGAAALVASALETFGDEFVRHARLQRCTSDGRSSLAPGHLHLIDGNADRVA